MFWTLGKIVESGVKIKFALVMIAMAGMGLLTAGSIQAQQSANNSSKGEDSPSKVSFMVYGAVRSPGCLESERPLRLAGAIEMAGGADDKATGTVEVIHTAGLKCGPLKVQMLDGRQPPPPLEPPPLLLFYKLTALRDEYEKTNPYLQPGDIVVVVEVPPVYVTGNVVAPQGLYLRDQTTLTRAITLAGGETRYADITKVKIYRTNSENSARSEFMFDVKGIRKGEAEDPILQPFDIIEIPYAKKWAKKSRSPMSPGPPVFDSWPFPARPAIPRIRTK